MLTHVIFVAVPYGWSVPLTLIIIWQYLYYRSKNPWLWSRIITLPLGTAVRFYSAFGLVESHDSPILRDIVIVFHQEFVLYNFTEHKHICGIIYRVQLASNIQSKLKTKFDLIWILYSTCKQTVVSQYVQNSSYLSILDIVWETKHQKLHMILI